MSKKDSPSHEPGQFKVIGHIGEKPTEQEEWDSVRGRVKHVPGGKMS